MMHKISYSIKLVLLLCLWNPTVSLDTGLMDIINSVRQTPADSEDMESARREDSNSGNDMMFQKLLNGINSINQNMHELKELQKQGFLEILNNMQRPYTSNSDSLVPFSSDKKTHVDFQTNEIQNKPPYAMRCSSYRALDEFIPVGKVTSNEMLIEAGWDAIYGPMYFCHALVDVNGIRCRLYGKGNRRSCWVTLPSGKEHKVDQKFHLLRKPHGVNIEWRSSWPTDGAKVPIPELKNSAGVPHEWAIWDVYTCGLAPKFYFGRCDKNGSKIPGLIRSDQKKGLTFTYGGKEGTCSNYDVLVCINK